MSKNLGDKQLMREDFHSTQTLSANGGVLSSATVSDGVMTCSGGGADYEFPDMDSFWEMGGTIRMIIQNDNVSGSKRFFNYTAGSTTRSITFLRTLSTGSNFLQIRDGAGNSFYWVNIISGQTTGDVEFVVTWDPATTTVTAWVDAADKTSDAVAGTQATTQDSTTHLVRAGSSVQGPWNGTVKLLEVYLGAIWTQEEVTDAKEEDTYREVDTGIAVVHAPLIAQFNDGTQKTLNNGTNGVAITMGDGSTAGSYPTVITEPFKGMSLDTTDDWIDFGDDDSYSFGDGATDSAFSISGVYTVGDETEFYLLAKGSAIPGIEYTAYGTSSQELIFTCINVDNTGNIGRKTATSFIKTGQVLSVVFTYDGSSTSAGMKIFVNGMRVDTVTSGSGPYVAMTAGAVSLRINNFDLGGGAAFSPMKTKDFAMWNFEMTERQARWTSLKAIKELNK